MEWKDFENKNWAEVIPEDTTWKTKLYAKNSTSKIKEIRRKLGYADNDNAHDKEVYEYIK